VMKRPITCPGKRHGQTQKTVGVAGHPLSGRRGQLAEGLEETFTINRLELSPSLRRCLGTTNIIESPHAGAPQDQSGESLADGKMVLRWAAAAFLATEKNFRRIQGYRDLWMLKAKLESEVALDSKEKAA